MIDCFRIYLDIIYSFVQFKNKFICIDTDGNRFEFSLTSEPK